MSFSSENVYSAFFARFVPLGPTGSGLFRTISRRKVMVEDCDAALMPALYVIEGDLSVHTRSQDGPALYLLNVDLVIYVAAPDIDTPMSPIFNPLADAVRAVLPPTDTLFETAGGVQFNPYQSGPQRPFESWLDLKSIVHIPVQIIAAYNS